jgi:hypothetical protein
MRNQGMGKIINDMKQIKTKKNKSKEKIKSSQTKRIKTRPSFTMKEGKKIKNLTKEIIKGFQDNPEISTNLKLKESIFYRDKKNPKTQDRKYYIKNSFKEPTPRRSNSIRLPESESLDEGKDYKEEDAEEKQWTESNVLEESFRKRKKMEGEKMRKKKVHLINEKLKSKNYFEDKYDGYNKEGLKKKPITLDQQSSSCEDEVNINNDIPHDFFEDSRYPKVGYKCLFNLTEWNVQQIPSTQEGREND